VKEKTMVWFKPSTWRKSEELQFNETIAALADEGIIAEGQIDEALAAFVKKDKITRKQADAQRGEGWETIPNIPGFGNIGTSSFNMFYSSYIDKSFKNELDKIISYRIMAQTTEIADVVEDAVNEAVQGDDENKIIHLDIINSDLNKNENIVKNIHKEFEELFYERINTEDFLWNSFRTYFIDGRSFYERIVDTNKKTKGIINVKRLPSETMDYTYDPTTGEIVAFYQYLKSKVSRPKSIEEAEKMAASGELIIFYPDQIGFVNSGIYGRTRYEIIGYLEKAKIPYNQLKLLETSIIIYRIIRSPERLVFRIDTGNMPRDKALKYVEKIKQRMSRKQTYDPTTGELTHEPQIFSLLENYFVPQSADGRGSQIESIGGDSKGFTELDDVYYFARKLYRALKYPMSRVVAGQENRQADIMFGGSQTGEIQRDEVKWAKFLERQQSRFTTDLNDLFLKHLEFKGLKKQYSLNKKSFMIRFTPPSDYREQMYQNFIESRFNNYSTLADRPEFSIYYLMKKYLKWDDEEITENVEGMKMDTKLGLKSEEEGF
jgi:hypothetical protein